MSMHKLKITIDRETWKDLHARHPDVFPEPPKKPRPTPLPVPEQLKMSPGYKLYQHSRCSTFRDSMWFGLSHNEGNHAVGYNIRSEQALVMLRALLIGALALEGVEVRTGTDLVGDVTSTLQHLGEVAISRIDDIIEEVNS